MKRFLLVLTFFTTAYSGVTSMGEWEINTPQNTLRLFTGDAQSGSYEKLKNLGEQANLYWKNNQKNMVAGMTTIFSPITSNFMVDIINQILNDDALLTKVAAASYRNATGFLKIVLVENGTKSWKIRLHVWKQGEKEYPHNHKWDFYSKILAGYLEQTIYNVGKQECKDTVRCKICEPVSLMPKLPNGDLPCPCRDSYQLATKINALSEYDSVYLGVNNRVILGTGESYFMPNNLVHTIAPGKKAITFVFTSEQVNDNSDVFVPEAIDASLKKYAPSVTKEELSKELCYIKNILQGLCVSPKYLPEMIDLEHRYYDKNDAIFNEPNWRNNFLVSSASRGLVVQFSDTEKKKYEVSVSDRGEILVGGKKLQSNSELLFVIFDGVMYAAPKDFAHNATQLICHTSFTDYASVESAGVLHFDSALRLQKIEAYSGHYAPSIGNMQVAINFLKTRGYDITNVLATEYIDRI